MKLIDRLFQLEEINGHGRCPTYLYRWTLFQPRWCKKFWRGFGVYVHHFVGNDWSYDLHDHPKRFISIGLKGRYNETSMQPVWVEDSYHGGPIQQLKEVGRLYQAPWVRTFAATHRHRIWLLPDEDCWTLVIVLRHVREWGFWHDGRWMHWRMYVGGGEGLADKMKACP